MTPTKWKRHMLKILVRPRLYLNDVHFIAEREQIKSFLESVHAENLYVYLIDRPQTDDFEWATIFNLELPNSVCESLEQARAYCDSVVETFASVFQQDLQANQVTTVWTQEASAVREGFQIPVNGVDLITSYYSWQSGVAPEDREREMWVHFGMEMNQKYYSSVHFNGGVDPNWRGNKQFDFVFESYVADPDGITQIYRAPLLEEMREHSKTFIDTNTRRLAFGRAFQVQLAPMTQ